MIATAASRISWYSRSVSVWAGATVMESPVCTPMASKFSIEQMMTTLSAVAHHLELVLLPAEDALLDQALVARRLLERPLDQAVELLVAEGDAAAGAAQGEARPDDRRDPVSSSRISRASSSERA